MHIIKTSPFQRDIIQYISESFLLMIRYLFKKGLTYSDANVDNYPYDYIIENTTLEELDHNALNFINQLKYTKVKELKKHI